MKTLPSNVSSNYLLVGNSPRFFVHIDTANRSWATATTTDYTNRIQTIQQITDSIDPFGGMGSISAVNVDVSKLGEEIKFYSSASIFPRYQGANVGAGRIYYSSASSYSAARTNTIGSGTAFTGISVGQIYGSSLWTVFRGFLQFTVPTGITSCEEAYIDLTPFANASDTDFSIYAVNGSWVINQISNNSFIQFSGWASGDSAYTGTVYSEPFSTNIQFSLSSASRIRLNRAGRDAIVTASAADPPVLKLMLLSSNDYSGTAPTQDEYVRFAVSAEDQTPTLELIYNTTKPDNERARIYLGYNDATTGLPSAVSSMLNLWSGVVDSWSLDHRLLSLSMRHDNFKHNVALGRDAITKYESGFDFCPDANIGKPKPIIIGDHTGIQHRRGCASIVEETNSNRWGGGDFVKGYVYHDQDNSYRKVIFSSHELKSYGTFMALYDGGVEEFVPIAGTATSTGVGKVVLQQGTASDFPYQMIENSTGETALCPIVCYPPTNVVGGSTIITGSSTIRYCINTDYTDWTEVAGSVTARFVDFQTYESWGIGTPFHKIAIYHESTQPGGYTSTGVKLVINYHDEDGTARQTTVPTTSDGPHFTYVSNVDGDGMSTLRESITDVQIEIYKHASSTRTFKFRNLAVMRGYSASLPDELYFKCEGAVDDGSGTYTGTTGALIENPSDVIRWFAMVKGGYIAAEIDSSTGAGSFTTARTDLSDWTFAFQWSDNSGIENLFNYEGRTGIVEELAHQCNSIVWEDYEGKLRMKVFDATDGFAVSGTDVPNNLDIFEYSGSPLSGSLTRHPIFSFKLSQMTVDDTYNDFVLKYGQNYATGDYNSVLTIDSGSGVAGSVSTNINSSYLVTSSPEFPSAATALAELKALTAACYNDINTTNTLVYEAWAIRSESTATKLLQRLVQWHSRRRYIVTLTTGLNAIGFELGDFINVRTDDIEDQFGTAFMNCKKWKITKTTTDLVACKIEIEAVEAEIY